MDENRPKSWPAQCFRNVASALRTVAHGRPLARAPEGGFHVARNRKNRGLRSVFGTFAAFCARLRAAGHWREL